MWPQNFKKCIIKGPQPYAFSLRKTTTAKTGFGGIWTRGRADLRVRTSGEGDGPQPERRACLDGAAAGSGARAAPGRVSGHEADQTSSRSRRPTRGQLSSCEGVSYCVVIQGPSIPAAPDKSARRLLLSRPEPATGGDGGEGRRGDPLSLGLGRGPPCGGGRSAQRLKRWHLTSAGVR